MKHISLKTKLLLSVLFTCTLIVITISLINLFYNLTQEKNRIHEEFTNFEQGTKQVIVEAVWQYDWEMVNTILKSQTSQVISYIEVCDQKSDKCLKLGDPGQDPFIEFKSPLFYQDKPHNNKIEIGTVSLQGHYDTFAEHIIRELPQLLLINLISVFGIAIVLFYLFHLQVVKRLLALERYTRKIDLQQLNNFTPPDDISSDKRKDEIDLLTDAVSGLIEKTKEEVERRQILEQQLNQAHKMEALGNLAGGIAHDFNNILAAILGLAELSSLQTEPDSHIHKNLSKIVTAGKRARDLTSQILVFSRRTETPKEILVLAKLVDEALNLIRASLPGNIRIKTDLDYNIRIKGDSTRLHQVVMNIATNGIQAIGDNPGVLSITLEHVILEKAEAEMLVLPPGDYCSLKICDNGPGIPNEIKERIFEPFFTTKKAGKGTGMGLAVVHGIIQNHNGTITVGNEPNGGTCFAIYLPSSLEELSEVSKPPSIPYGAGQKVILVDDEQQVLEMGEAILKSLGYKVSTFSDPAAATVFFSQEKSIDLVITDYDMPDIDGIKLATSFKGQHPDVPVLLWTGYQNDIALEGLNSGVINQIIQKPFNLELLAQAIEHLLNNKQQ